jgi:cytochrome c-type biogenesis protein
VSTLAQVSSYATLFGAGLLTFASPCVLPLLPVYVATLGGASAGAVDDDVARRRLRLAGLGFATGLSVVFVGLGMGASFFAKTLVAHRQGLLVVAGVLLALTGLKLAGVLRLRILDRVLDRDARPLLERVPTPGGFFGGVLFGAAFGAGWTPCVGPVLGAALTYAASTATSPWRAGAQLAAFALGLSAPLVAAAFAATKVLAWTKRLRAATPVLQRAMGVGLVLVAVPMIVANLPSPRGTVAAAPNAPADDAAGGAPCAPSTSACAQDLSGVTKAAALTGKPRLVEFVSGTCPSCAKMAPLVDDLVLRCAKDGSLLRVTLDDPDGRALASRYGVRMVPTFVGVDASGTEVTRIVGEQAREALEQALVDVRGQACPSG